MLPLVFFVLAALMILSFYVHDRAVLQALVCEASSSGSNFMTGKERSQAAASVKKQITESRFLGSRNLSGNAAAGSKSVVSSWSAVYPVPGLVRKYFSGNKLSIQADWTSPLTEPADTIRKIRGAGKFLTGGKS